MSCVRSLEAKTSSIYWVFENAGALPYLVTKRHYQEAPEQSAASADQIYVFVMSCNTSLAKMNSSRWMFKKLKKNKMKQTESYIHSS